MINIMSLEGERFIHQKEGKLHTSPPVEHEQERRKRAGEETSQKPAEKLENWMDVLERTHMGHRDDPKVMERIKNHYHKQHVIAPEEIPEGYFENQRQLAREQGHGDIEITDKYRNEQSEIIVNDQKKSLDKWVNYLISDDANYPSWAKYWAFQSMLKMGKFKKSEGEEQNSEGKKEAASFAKRKKDTIVPFPMLNARALSETLSVVEANINEKQKAKKDREPITNTSTKLNDTEFKQLLSTESFSKIYAQFLIEMPEYSTEGLKETRGEWVKYDQGSAPEALVKSLEGYPLEWCTANIAAARTQLNGGDFYVYYSIDDTGEAKIPRLAIRMDGNNKIGEDPRGIASDQNLDPYIGDVLEEKLNEFPDKEAYKKKSSDMKRVTKIEDRYKAGEELSKEDLSFLYELDEKIEGFGHGKDPRIEEMLEGRDPKEDLSDILNIPKERISTTKEEAFSGDIAYHHGDLYLDSLTSAEGLTLPESIGGNLDLDGLTSAEGLTLPESIGGYLNLRSLTSAEGLTLPESIGGYLYLDSLTSAEGLTLPESIGGDLDLRSLTSAEGLTFPESIGGDLDLLSLTSAEKEKLRKKYPQHNSIF